MIAFASLFLGLVLGVQPLEVVVGEPVTRVELHLDGRLVGTVDAPPWRLSCDFGEALAPHELVAIGFDAQGEEVSRARQWVNLPRPAAGASLVLEATAEGPPRRAFLTWESLTGGEPLAIDLTFNGEPLESADPRTIELPSYDPKGVQFLRAELLFPGDVSSVAEIAFGGLYADEISTELTAVAVRLVGRKKIGDPAALSGWFAEQGAALEVVGVEKGPAEVVLVLDAAARERILDLEPDNAGNRRFYSGRLDSQVGGSWRGSASDWLRYALRLRADQQLRFLWPSPRRQRGAGQTFDLFPPSPAYSPSDGGVWWLMSRAQPPSGSDGPQRLADAVAVAGVSAAGRERRRAVVVVVSDNPQDESAITPSAAREYLHRLNVPLLVWRVGPSTPYGWGEVVDASSFGKLERAVKELSRMLERQRIVWLSGRYLPQKIALTPRAGKLEIAR